MKRRFGRLRGRFAAKKRKRSRRPRGDFKRAKKRLKMIAALILTAAALAYTFSGIERRIDPLVRDMALSNLSSLVVRECNDAVSDAVENDGVDYDALVNKETDSRGRILSLSVNYKNFNGFKSRLTRDIQSRIDKINSVEVFIPIMSMFSDRFYSALGFPVKIKVMTDENIHIDFSDSFEAAGINQTRHLISVKVTAEMGVNTPVRASGDDIVTEIPIAETIIVGDTPLAAIGGQVAEKQ